MHTIVAGQVHGAATSCTQLWLARSMDHSYIMYIMHDT